MRRLCGRVKEKRVAEESLKTLSCLSLSNSLSLSSTPFYISFVLFTPLGNLFFLWANPIYFEKS